MNLLLDSHALLWFLSGEEEHLSPTAKEAIENPENHSQVSAASLWELAIKASLGRLILSGPFEEVILNQMDANGFDLLSIQPRHIAKIVALPYEHRDPFDRMLVAQCLVDNLTLVSRDSALEAYKVERLW